ncbi:hypothetical protein [Lysobacter niastensis]|uniref:Uncharacterized protein n=1 Tax=Lysobacter niastensis TaxID=380629 RepID=A0ABS0B7A7_9GAMM|nr:hypothetical protein [Lysobacter niastensis]MBF6024898.1 hypothetical protein [Lysobacter niastensis]
MSRRYYSVSEAIKLLGDSGLLREQIEHEELHLYGWMLVLRAYHHDLKNLESDSLQCDGTHELATWRRFREQHTKTKLMRSYYQLSGWFEMSASGALEVIDYGAAFEFTVSSFKDGERFGHFTADVGPFVTAACTRFLAKDISRLVRVKNKRSPRSDREESHRRVHAAMWAQCKHLPDHPQTLARKLATQIELWGFEKPTEGTIADTILSPANELKRLSDK